MGSASAHTASMHSKRMHSRYTQREHGGHKHDNASMQTVVLSLNQAATPSRPEVSTEALFGFEIP